jgi:RNA-directed DNA polymerase
VDGITIQQINDSPNGPRDLVANLHRELKTKTYKPQAVRRTYIPKSDGKLRPLGIPSVRDRVVQMAAKLILEPLFEADFLDVSHGYRPARSAQDALRVIEQSLREGYKAIYDADLQAYFDTIPHDKLMKCVERRVADGAVLGLIRMWLTALVEERDEDGRVTRQRPTQGTPQGGVISPLLANLYLHWFDVQFYRSGPGRWQHARLIRYADDFVILARSVNERMVKWVEETIEDWLGLQINRRKTRVIKLTPMGASSLDFLSYTFRYEWGWQRRRQRFLVAIPSATSLAECKADLRELINSRRCFMSMPELVKQVNHKLRGWGEYFSFGYPRREHRAMNAFVIARLTKHLHRRSQRGCRPPAGMSYYSFLTRRLGLQLL